MIIDSGRKILIIFVMFRWHTSGGGGPCLLAWVPLLLTMAVVVANGGEGALASTASSGKLRPPVHPRKNVEDFPTVAARFVRLRVFRTNVREPCVDELEVYGEGEPARNLALASTGARATASGVLPG